MSYEDREEIKRKYEYRDYATANGMVWFMGLLGVVIVIGLFAWYSGSDTKFATKVPPALETTGSASPTPPAPDRAKTQ